METENSASTGEPSAESRDNEPLAEQSEFLKPHMPGEDSPAASSPSAALPIPPEHEHPRTSTQPDSQPPAPNDPKPSETRAEQGPNPAIAVVEPALKEETSAEAFEPKQPEAAQPSPQERAREPWETALENLRSGQLRLRAELGKVIIGQEKVIEQLMIALFCGGHCLISGPPGLAKTLLIRTLAQILDLRFKRIQFTPDLMPADITGTEIIEEQRGGGQRALRFIPGPIFTNVLLADEINRTPPKTQAALLEAMEERQVTVAGETYPFEPPFYVFATQNPIELEGTYPLPEAQLDRFMFKILIEYLDEDLELEVATKTTSGGSVEVETVFSGEQMLQFAKLVRLVPIAEPLARYAVRLVQSSRPNHPGAPEFIRNWVSWGAGTRASQYLILGAKSRALLQGRLHVALEDIQTLALPVLRHRILTGFQADADRVDVDQIIGRLLETVPKPETDLA